MVVDVLEVEKRMATFFGVEVQSYPLSPSVSAWGRMLSVNQADVAVTVICTDEGFSVEVRDGMQAEIKRGCQTIEEVLAFAADHTLAYLACQISDRKAVTSRLRLHESLLVKTSK